MSIALFEAFPRITISQPDLVGGSRAGMLIGMGMRGQDGARPFGIVLLEDGSVSELDLWAFSIDFRYDPRSDQFKDKDAQEPDQEG